MVTTRWRLLPHDPARIAALSHSAKVSSLIAQILINRGISEPADARRFLDAKMSSLHDPEFLPGAPEAASR